MCWEIFCQSLKEDVISQDFKHAIKVFFFYGCTCKTSWQSSYIHAKLVFSGRWLGMVWFWFLKPFYSFQRKEIGPSSKMFQFLF